MNMHDPALAVDLVRFKTIVSVIDESQNILLNHAKDFYFTIDTLFLNADGFTGMWQWMEGGLKRFLDVTLEISNESHPHRFHRLILVPRPNEFSNNFKRDLYRTIIRTVIHYHLWHGVVCYVVFVSKQHYNSPHFLRLLDFGSIGSDIVFDTANYYSSRFRGLNLIEGEVAETHVRKCLDAIREADIKESIQLYYDDKTFENRRRPEDMQWRNVKHFYYMLFGGICPGPDCSRSIPYGEATLDHIIPQGSSNNVLLNLRMLCSKCNRNKWKLDTGEIPFELAYSVIPERVATDEIRHIISDKSPDWLSRFGGPPTNVLKLLRL